jgi:hypothetical protein
MSLAPRTTTTPGEAIGIVAICFGWLMLSSLASMDSTRSSPAFSDGGFIFLMSMEAVLATVAIFVLRARRYDIRSLYPAPTGSGLAVGVL